MARMLGAAAALILVLAPSSGQRPYATDMEDDYYFGFSQGVYYGLMLAGEDYHVAWCMKSELEYEAPGLGSGGEFQRKLEALLALCRRDSTPGAQ